jgi:hypothetical protein
MSINTQPKILRLAKNGAKIKRIMIVQKMSRMTLG